MFKADVRKVAHGLIIRYMPPAVKGLIDGGGWIACCDKRISATTLLRVCTGPVGRTQSGSVGATEGTFLRPCSL